MTTVNWDGTSTFDLLPEGTYTAEVVEVKEETREKGTSWAVRFNVIDGPYTGRWFYDRFFLYGKALGKLKIAYKAFGLSAAGQDDICPTDIVGKKADVVIIHGEYKGSKQVQVPFDGYRKPYGVEPSDGSDADTGEPPF